MERKNFVFSFTFRSLNRTFDLRSKILSLSSAKQKLCYLFCTTFAYSYLCKGNTYCMIAKPLFRIIVAIVCLFLCGCASHREAVPENWPFRFNDNNPHQLAAAQQYGIEPLETRDDLRRVKRKLKHIEENKYYAVDPLTHSVPYLTPDAAKLLKDIGKKFQKSLKKHKMGEYKIIVTSVLRTKDDVRKLMKVNSNAVANSAHCHATTFDLSYRRFKYVGGKQATQPQMKYLLGEVLDKLRKDNRCFVRYETKQTCLHITVSP